MKRIKKLGIATLVLAVLAVILVVTCPDREDHQEAMKAVITNVLDDEISVLPSKYEEVLSKFGLPVAGKVVDVVMKHKLIINNYYLFSTGEVHYKGESKLVSFGILGHVFTFDEDDLREAIHKK